MTNGFISSWTDLKTIKLQVIERDSASTGVALHISSYNSSFGESNSTVIKPELEITVIGEETTTSGGGTSIDSTTDVSMNDLEVFGDISCNAVKLGGHIIPDTNAAYDLGNAEYKIRHLFLSDNSLWIGDNHKIDIVSGKMKFKKRKNNIAPASIVAAGGDIAGALTATGVGSVESMTLKHWHDYAKTLNVGGGVGQATIDDLFVSGTAGDWEEDEELSSTTTKKGQVLETLVGYCDGSTITVESGTYTMPTQTLSNLYVFPTTFTKDPASEIDYTAPTGTERLMYKYIGKFESEDSNAMINYKLYIDNVEASSVPIYYRSGTSPTGAVTMYCVIKKTNSLDLTQSHNYHIRFRSYTVNHEYKVRTDLGFPQLEIVAIGEGTVGAVSNAVTTSGDQTIAGTKTFSNAIISASYTTTQRDALTAVAGMVIFNTTVNKHQGYDGSSWNNFY